MKYAEKLLSAALVTALVAAVPAFGDGDQGWLQTRWASAHAEYKQECGSCHMAYQPGLLPARSWERMMSSLDNHFGQNAELADDVRTSLLAYLKQNAADTSDYKRSRRIMSSLRPTDAPLRISETPYIEKKHQEILGSKTKVRSVSQCQECHTGAEKGSYNERDIVIPGMGRWQH